ncbi:MAG: glycosyltransferase family 4 protein [Acidobacteria bacterium]|nr:glycosyltransferase family 4 protein [Acidobacteriota bacterium]
MTSSPPRHTVVIATSSYPRFPGDLTGTAVEPIARGVAARGHAVHVVAPWHPLVRRGDVEDGIHYHFYRYAPVPALNVFGYAGSLRADVSMKGAAYAAAPFAVLAGMRMVRRVVREHGATLIHAHWAIPSGVIAAAGASDLPLVISLHGSDIFVAERNGLARLAARRAFRRADRVTGCSADLRDRAVALGADDSRAETLLHGVDASRFTPNADTRARVRAEHGIGADDPIVFAVGRLVRKKGFEHLIDAVASLAPRHPRLRLVIAGGGDLDAELRERAAAGGVADHVMFLGAVAHGTVADWLAAADISAAPSVVDDAGNVDGLPNTVLEALASATPVVATLAGGIGAVAVDGETALIVPERDAGALAGAIETLVQDPALGARIGQTARQRMQTEQTWARVAERFEQAYALAADHRASLASS